MNARTQITIDPEIQRRAQEKAAELGISFAEYVRRLIATDLGGARRKVDVSVVFDLGGSDKPTDVARDKDRLVGEALWSQYVRKARRKPSQSRRAK
jgi:hypothetical protein